jgi:hypothetical protein
MKNLIVILLILIISKIATADSLNISNLGLTYHGQISNDKKLLDVMTRKVTSNGRVAQHVEMNLTYTFKSNLFINGTVLQDCFNHTAYHLALGKQWSLLGSKTTFVMLSGGLYVRPAVDELLMSVGTRTDGIDYIPVAWIGLKKNIELTKDLSLSFQINTNYFLTHGNVGFEFKF